MRSKAGPTIKTVTTEEEAEKFLSNADGGVFGFLSDASGTLAREFQKVADSLNEDFRFGVTTEADLLKKYEQEE